MTRFKRNFTFDKNVNELVSTNIRKYRKLTKTTQEQLALDTDKSYDYIRRIEYMKGKVGCSLNTIYEISVVLNTPLYKFFMTEEDEEAINKAIEETVNKLLEKELEKALNDTMKKVVN